jgi:FkbM family methyltransferase
MIKQLLKKILAGMGVGVYRLKSVEAGEKHKTNGPNFNLKWLHTLQVKSVIDIGANEGQFAWDIRKAYPDMDIYSFEPLADCFRLLTEQFKGDKHFFGYNCALGEKTERKIINRNEYDAASSLLHVTEEHKINFPTASREFPEEIAVNTFDDVLSVSSIQKPYLVKIDVQGYEKQVIRGSQELIKNAACLIVEVSFHQLYKDQPLFPEIYNLLNELGFAYQGAFDVLRSPMDAQILQEDAIFLKRT